MQDKEILTQAKDLISREIKFCRTLRAIISRELEAIVLNGDMDELFNVLSKKDEIISQLQLLSDSWRDLLYSSGLGEIHESVDNTNSTEGFGKRLLELYPDDNELPALINETHEIAASIIKAEDDAISELEKHSADIRSQMASRVHGRNAAASYARMGGSII